MLKQEVAAWSYSPFFFLPDVPLSEDSGGPLSGNPNPDYALDFALNVQIKKAFRTHLRFLTNYSGLFQSPWNVFGQEIILGQEITFIKAEVWPQEFYAYVFYKQNCEYFQFVDMDHCWHLLMDKKWRGCMVSIQYCLKVPVTRSVPESNHPPFYPP